MPGAPLTIQFGETCPDAFSPGLWLNRSSVSRSSTCRSPSGSRQPTRLIGVLRNDQRDKGPEALATERGWLLDGMADAHKYNAEGRPVIYGEPELVYAMTRICCENGVVPVVIASGSGNSRLAQCLEPVLSGVDEHPGIPRRDGLC